MIIDRIFTPGLAQVAYFVADETTKQAAIIDPRRDIGAYLDWTRFHGMKLVAILETHVHADFVSGARELAAATDATIYTSRIGDQAVPHEALDDGDEISVGGLRLRALWTPGHTPEHMSFLVTDPTMSDEPSAIFTGDALFVGEVGRPDLLGEKETQGLAAQLFQTVNERFRDLNDDLVVYPGHTAGSACGKKIGEAPSTTIGQEKLFNYAFKFRDKASFIESVLAGMPSPPTYYPVLKQVNKQGPTYLNDLHPGDVLTSDNVARLQDDGALVIDTRTPEEFGAGHIPGAISVGLGANFSAWMGWLAPYNRDLVLILESDSQIDMALTELRRIGLDRVAGYLKGGMSAWLADGRDVATLAQISVQDLVEQRAGTGGVASVLDVRSDDEWKGGHITDACHLFAGEIAQGASGSFDKSDHFAVICGSGYRSSVAASLLLARGYRNVANVSGGMGAWDANEQKMADSSVDTGNAVAD